MAPSITIVGGGSYQWAPKLLIDFANTPLLHDAEIVIQDIDPVPVPRMVEFVEHLADVRGIGMTATGTTDQRQALEGADYVIVNISTGGFDSMRHDLAVPAKYGVMQAVGDSVGPGGIVRALRNIPVFLELAAEHGRALSRRVDAQSHQPDDDDLPLGDARDVGEDGRALSRDRRCAVRAQSAPRLQLPRDHADGRGREPPPVHHRARRRRHRRHGAPARGPGGRRPEQGRPDPAAPREARAVRALRRAPRRGRPPRRRVLLRLPHRGVGVGPAVGRAPHHHRRARARAGPPRETVRADARGRHGVGVAVGRDGGAGDPVLRARRTGLVPAQHPEPRPGGRPARRGDGREHLRRRRQGPPRPRRGAAAGHDGRVPAPGVGVAGAHRRGRRLRRTATRWWRRCCSTRSPGASTTTGSAR